MVFADAVGDDLPSSHILNAGQIPDGSVIDQAAHITAPNLMRLGDRMDVFQQVVIGVMRARRPTVTLDGSPGWAQLEQCHDPLSAFVVDPQMQGYPSMPIGRMISMKRFDLLLECLVFGRLPPLAIDVLPINP